MSKKGLIILFVATLFISTLTGVVVNSVQGKGEAQIGMVNMEAVYTQYMAPPLFTARDQMQKDFDVESEGLEAEGKQELFVKYQEELSELEKEYKANVDEAITAVGKELGVDVIIDSSTVLFGGVDLTEDVINSLQ